METNQFKTTQKSLSEKERYIGFVYVLIFFIAIVCACGYILLTSQNAIHTLSNKSLVVKKMERLKNFQDFQQGSLAVADTLYERILHFEPGVNALYEEDDIKFMTNELTNQWDKNQWDKRNKMFWHIASIYDMWFTDKKELWSRQENIKKFKRNLEDCELGLQKKENEITSKQK